MDVYVFIFCAKHVGFMYNEMCYTSKTDITILQAFKQCRPHLQIVCTYGGTAHPTPLEGGAAVQKVNLF